MPKENPLEDWTSDDEYPKDHPESGATSHGVDWISSAKYFDKKDGRGKRWYYSVKWSGWKDAASTYEPKENFEGNVDMPAEFWKGLKLPFEPTKPEKEFREYTCYKPLLTRWVDGARELRHERKKEAEDKRRKKQARLDKKNAKGKEREQDQGNTKEKEKENGTRRRSMRIESAAESDEEPSVSSSIKKPKKRKIERDEGQSDASSSAPLANAKKHKGIIAISDSDDGDAEELAARPAKKKGRESTGSTRGPGQSPSSPTSFTHDSVLISRSSSDFGLTDASSSKLPSKPQSSTQAQPKPASVSQSRALPAAPPKVPSNLAPLPPVKRKAKFISPLAVPQPALQPRPLSPPRDDYPASPPKPRSPSPAPAGPEPLFRPATPEAEEEAPVATKTTIVSPPLPPAPSAPEAVAPAIANGKPAEPEETPTRNGLLSPDPTSAPVSRSSSSDISLKARIEARKAAAEALQAEQTTKGVVSIPEKAPSAVAPAPPAPNGVSSSSRPRAHTPPSSARLAASVNLVLGSSSSTYSQTIGSIHLLDAIDSPSSSSPSAQRPTLQTLLGHASGCDHQPELFFKETFSVYRAAVIFATRPEVLEYCRVEPSPSGTASERANREESFMKAVWWLEEAYEGGSISIAYLSDPTLAFVVLPRASPLCPELDVPSKLRDRGAIESLVGVLVRLARPSVPIGPSSSSSASDVTLEHWGFTPSFIHEARDSLSILIYAPRSLDKTVLPAITRLYARLTGPRSQSSSNPGSKVTVLSPGQPMPVMQRDLVLVHNAVPLWSLPGLVEMRKRQETRFFSFGVAKGGDASFSSSRFVLDPFATGTMLLIVLSPSVFNDHSSTSLTDLSTALYACTGKVRVFVHPTTSCTEEARPVLERCESLPVGVVEQEAVLGEEQQQCADTLRFLRASMNTPAAAKMYRRFIVAGPLDTTAPLIRDLSTGLELMSVQKLVQELQA